MANYNEFLNIMKKAAKEAVEAGNPVAICFGKVTGVSPLKILVEQKMTLGSQQLILTKNVTDYKVNVTIDAKTETTGAEGLPSHSHDVTGMKEMTIHNALKTGEEVVLLRMQGGQKYLVLDRIGG